MSDDPEKTPPTGDSADPLDPAEIASILGAFDAEDTPATKADGPDPAVLYEDTPLGEVDADGLLIQQPAGPPESPQEPAGEAQPLDMLDLEAVLTATPVKYTLPPEDAAPAEDITDDSAPSPVADAPAVLLTDPALDLVLAAATMPPVEPVAEAHAGGSAPSSVPEAPHSPDQPEVSGQATADALDQAELNHLMAMAQLPPEAEAEAPSGALDASELEALIAGMPEDAQLAGIAPEAPLSSLATGEGISLSQENVDSLLGVLGTTETAPATVPERVPAPGSAAAPPPDEPISQDMLNALLAAAAAPSAEAAAAVGSENLAAAATAPAPSVPAAESVPADVTQHEQDDLARLIEESRKRAAQEQQAAGLAEPPRPLRERRVPKSQSALWAYLRENGARVAASLAAGMLVGGTTFVWLMAQQERVPDIAVLAMQRGSALEEAMDQARRMIDEGEYQRAAALLSPEIEAAPAGRERTDAAFLRLEALYKAVPGNAPLSAYDTVQTEIDLVLAAAPEHPRVPEALHWKARLHERGELPFAALDTYDQIITRHPGAPHMDEILVEAARLALELGAPDRAARFADQAVREFPASPYFAEAKLLQGDAYARAGQRGTARQLYAEALREGGTSLLGTEAVLRIGQLEYDEGNYTEAIRQIRDYLNVSTTPEGNDAAYMLLAQAYRKLGQNNEARAALNELIRFFPESKLAPKAYVGLSEALEALGERKAALRIAQEAGERFPADPHVLKNLGDMLGLDGNPFSAATTLLAANAAGSDDPGVLLTAARHFRTAGILDQAQRVYSQLIEEFGGSPESFTGGVELAELIYERGDAKRAIERLETIATATQGGPRQLPALLALARIFDDLGMEQRAAEVSRRAAGLTDDSHVLAEAATAMIHAGSLTEGQDVANRVDIAQVDAPAAYAMLSALGTALLEVDPARGIAKLEEAYANYPGERRAANDLVLVRAYLDADRVAGARRVVLDMAARAAAKPDDAPFVVDAATAWGDYLYASADYRAAADAYTLADEAAAGASAAESAGARTDPRWPRFQRANALLQLGDYEGSLALLREIAESDAPWANEAAVKADVVTLQESLRKGAPLPGPTPAPVASAG